MTEIDGQFIGALKQGEDIPLNLIVYDTLKGNGINLSSNPSYRILTSSKVSVAFGNLVSTTGIGRYYETYTIPAGWSDGIYVVEYSITYDGNDIYVEDTFIVGDIGSTLTPKDIWDYILDCTTPLVPKSAGWHLFNARDMSEILFVMSSSC